LGNDDIDEIGFFVEGLKKKTKKYCL
jgi:hypothetical protein